MAVVSAFEDRDAVTLQGQDVPRRVIGCFPQAPAAVFLRQGAVPTNRSENPFNSLA